jgi:hypothetical protein
MRQDPYWLEMDKKRKRASRKPVDKAKKAAADNQVYRASVSMSTAIDRHSK